jgi:23S rRNA pseudouridine1911/1915/1917 synthase
MLSKRLGSRGRPPLGVVHRLDKDTSGLLMFSRTLAAKKELSLQLRRHSVHRVYLALAHGHVSAGSHTSRLVPNRGDGVRGSTQNPKLGRPSTTHLEPVEHFAGATLVRCRLETGRTHQIRIHLSEAGSPLVGEEVYIRRYAGRLIDAPRMMLHALELGFTHPTTGEVMQFRGEPPEDFQRMLASLRKR